MKFYIVTPAYNAMKWLPRCIRSVADQVEPGIEVHHHVQDGGSVDGSVEWLMAWQADSADVSGYTFSYTSTADNGMYDAINKAWELMPSDAAVTAHLNSDEQYLPGALQGVSEAFERDLAAEIVLGTFIVVDAESRYVCHRRPVKPARWRSRTVCEIITCSCFHKVETFKQHMIRFDTSYRTLSDMLFYREIVNYAPHFCVVPQLVTSVFTVTGDNLAWSQTAQREWNEEMKRQPWYVVLCHAVAYRVSNLLRRITDVLHDAPESYSVYMPKQTVRKIYSIRRPTAHWGMRVVSDDN